MPRGSNLGSPEAFTPGPWDCTGCLFPDDGLGGVYYRVQAEGIDARAANARLIAAAPELYQALGEMVRDAERNQRPGGGDVVPAKAYLALAKARGEQ